MNTCTAFLHGNNLTNRSWAIVLTPAVHWCHAFIKYGVTFQNLNGLLLFLLLFNKAIQAECHTTHDRHIRFGTVSLRIFGSLLLEILSRRHSLKKGLLYISYPRLLPEYSEVTGGLALNSAQTGGALQCHIRHRGWWCTMLEGERFRLHMVFSFRSFVLLH